MNPSTYIGRVGGLAVALGVGAAILGGSATAWAGPDTPAPPGPAASDPGTGGAPDVKSAIRKAVKDSLSHITSATPRPRELGTDNPLKTNLHALTDTLGAHLSTSTTPPQHRTSGTNTLAVKPSLTATPPPTLGATRPRLTRALAALSSEPIAQSLPDTLTTMAPGLKPTPNATATNGVGAVVATVVNQILRPLGGNTPSTPPVHPPVDLVHAVQLAGLRRGLSGAAASLGQPSSSAASPTLVVNGYNIVPDPNRPEEIGSFYGLFTTPPATPGTVQGVQEFHVVDPNTGDTVGTFHALVNNTNSFVLTGTYQEIVVTDGTDNAATPPPNTLIATNRFGPFGLFGTLYTSTPTAPGEKNAISFKVLTPFGDIPIPLTYDATKVLTDVSVPVELADGYYLAPAPGSPEKGIAVTGIAPYFAVYQGEQVFNVYKTGSDVPVGSFKGYVASTADILASTTQAILVTEYISGTKGTGPGDVPPPGAVYNVLYGFGLSALYSAVPSPVGGPTEANFNIRTRLTDINIPWYWDATATPAVASLPVPGKYTFVPTSDLQPIGVNGLPPREVQIQGYQQFDVYDSGGSKIGSIDADVTTQYSFLSTLTESVLVTNVPEGTDPASLPPVGSQFSFAYLPGGTVGVLYSAIPLPSGDVTTWSLLTPLGNVTVPFPFYNPVKGLDDVTYIDPFDV